MRPFLVLAAGALAACAKGGALGNDDANGQPADASKRVDAVESFDDAPTDAAADARPIDAPSLPDACVPVVTELLVNPSLDSEPVGTGWQQLLINSLYPLITSDDGIVEQSAPYKAWLGGLEASSGSVTDKLWQDVTVPANTTALVLTGYYEVRTSEDPADPNVYDTGSFALTQTNDTVIANVLTVSNKTPTTAWTAINNPIGTNLSGMTVRLRMTSSNDILNATSFYFDTLSLKATHCP